MVESFTLREAKPADADGLAALAEISADGGAVSFRVVEHVPSGWEGDRAETRTIAVVAEVPGAAGIAGAARLTLGRFRYEGGIRPFALLGALMVAPEHRRHGIAAALARWRIDRARAEAGHDVVVLADIQRGNTASLAAARRWATAFTAPAISAPVPMRSRPPRGRPGLTIRQAVEDDLPAVVEGLARFTAERNFSRVWSVESFSRWLRASPFEEPIRHCRIAVDRDGTILAGLALREEGRLRSMELVRMPAAIRAANLLLHVVPADGVLRNLTVEHLWHAPGRLDAAAALWQDARWSLRGLGSNLLIFLDARDPLRSAIGLRPWSPTTSITAAVLADPPPQPSRLLDPLG